VRKWTVDFHKLIYTHTLLIGVPTIFYYCLRLGGFTLVDVHMVIATFFLFSSIVIIYEACTAMFRRSAIELEYAAKEAPPGAKLPPLGGRKLKPQRHPLPKCSFLVAAYLPNEQDIVLETLDHLLHNIARPEGGLEIILAYNTPQDLPVEQDLRRLVQTYPELKLVRVEGSHSKAENLNAAMDQVTGQITCILDTDHHPAPDCFVRAWRWLENGYDVVQGRNVIRNHRHNLLTKNIAVEFESVYGVSHQAKSFITDSSIFGGSNGYWRTEVLQRIRFNPSRLTEDIDASMRTLLSGYRIVHDRSIITTELAPVDFNSFWFQRKRWAQGWLEVSLIYQRKVWRSSQLSLWQKVYWTYLLYYCVFYSLIALQILPLILSSMLYQGPMPGSDNLYLLISTIITFSSGIIQTLATFKMSAMNYPKFYYPQHAVLIFLYTILKNMISVVGIYDHISGKNSWVVTPRGAKQRRALPQSAGLTPVPSAVES
jgi:cellulose synthase/poly-beta-1,6-N-acetylglucosamine synthase-like glycosyltransferase